MALADLLRDARERRGLTLEQLADETKIAVDRLTAFERDGLPPKSGFYHRAQIRAYAHALSLDERRVLDTLDQELAATPAPTPLTQTPKVRTPRISVSSSAVALVCVIAGAFISGTLLTRQMQTARGTESLPSAPGGERADRAVRMVQDNHTASSDVARAGLAGVAVVEPAAAPAVVPAAPAAPAVPATPAVTQLVIATKPEGARVTVDGIGWGVTPVTIRHLPEGRKRIRVIADGYVAAERVVDVQPDRANRVSIQLRSLLHPLQPAP